MKRSSLAASVTVFGLAGSFALSGGCSSQSTTSGGAIGGVQSMLFIKRQTTVPGQAPDVAGGNGQVLDYQRYVPGGSLNLLSPVRADGTVTNLTSSFPKADFNGADVSFDASQAVFSMKIDGSDHYHIYTVQLTPGADGTYVMHQKTAGNYDDINPIYIPGGQIAFVTNEMYTPMGTRADEYEHAREALQLATISIAGGDADRHLFAQNLSHLVAPFLRADGRIGFSQWEHFAAVNDVKVRTLNPDGTQEVAVAGQHDNSLGFGKPGDALFTVKEISPNFMIGIVTARDRTIHAGALVEIDARNHADSVCLDAANYVNGAVLGHQCLNEEDARYTVLTPNVPTGTDPSPVGRYREPSVLPDGRILTSWADGPVSDLNEQSATPPDFGIYVFDQKTGQNQLVYNDRATWDLNALAVVTRAEPPVIGNIQRVQDSTKYATIGSVDISQTSLNEQVSGAQFNNTPLGTALAQGTVAVRVIEGFSSEAVPGATMFGLTMFEGAAVLGEAPVYNDHSWEVNVTPYLPIHLQPIDKYGLSIRNQQLWIQAMPGENRRCGGCHESRTGTGILANAPTTIADQQLVSQAKFTEPIAQRTEFPWATKVQAILDAKCVSCHNSSTTSYYQVSRTDAVSGVTTTYQVPTLDLSSNPVTVYYDKKVMTWAASYVSIFYPATISMDGGGTGKVKVTGANAPCSGPGLSAGPAGCTPLWGIPGSARASALPEKLNLHGLVNGAADGTTAWPIASHPLHPEDVGTTLTDQERQTIAVYPMDLGGQYFARQGGTFKPYVVGDPVTPAGAVR
jgi:hypothetical protein